MSVKTARPATAWDSRPGLDDFCGQRKSRSSLAQLRLRRQRHVQRIHRLGERSVFEFVDELARHHPEICDDLDRRLARFAAIDPALLRWAGGDRFPQEPIRLVGGGP